MEEKNLVERFWRIRVPQTISCQNSKFKVDDSDTQIFKASLKFWEMHSAWLWHISKNIFRSYCFKFKVNMKMSVANKKCDQVSHANFSNCVSVL